MHCTTMRVPGRTKMRVKHDDCSKNSKFLSSLRNQGELYLSIRPPREGTVRKADDISIGARFPRAWALTSRSIPFAGLK